MIGIEGYAEFAVHVCEVDGCENLAPAERYCAVCRTELEALRQMQARKAERQATQRWRRLITPLRLLLVVAGVFYLVLTFGAAWLQWLGVL